MRVIAERERGAYLVRLMSRRWSEIAYLALGLRGLQAEVEFPSDWHERRAGWVRLGFGVFRVAFSFPWKWTVPDESQCSGPTYGFHFHSDSLVLHWGKSKGRRDDPIKFIKMPWQWRHREHKVLTQPEAHPYTYTLRSGEEQRRTATIQVETRLWTRPWLPHTRLSRSIDVTFDGEVGERSGSWKGGVIGCGYEMLVGERPVDTLRRMERERKFT